MDIAAFARGYLQLIGSSNRGEGIRLAADALSPVLDIKALLGVSQRRSVLFTTAGMVTGVNNMFTVPQGKIWIVRAVSANMGPTAAAGNSVNRAAMYMLPAESPSQSSLFLTGNVTADGAVPDSRGTLVWQPVDFVMTAGSALGVLGTVVGAVSLSGHAYVDEINA